jgi:glutathione-regulated potassium-efflux system ancillary protein KefG
VRILILFAHPALEKSRVHRRLVQAVASLPGVTFHDLYERYPNFHIDVDHEQRLLREHDLYVWQHPVYWYSAPALLKQWLDLVLTHGWAYGAKGTALQGRYVLSAISTGGASSSYQRGGFHDATIQDFLLPIRRTVTLCKMTYLDPFVVYGAHRLQSADLDNHADCYAARIVALRDGLEALP